MLLASLVGCAVEPGEADPVTGTTDALAEGPIEVDLGHDAARPYAPGVLIVELTPALADTVNARLAAGGKLTDLALPTSLVTLNRQVGASELRTLFPLERVSPTALSALRERYAARTGRAITNVALPRLDAFYVLRVSNDTDLEMAREAYAKDKNVRSAELDLTVKPFTNDTYGNITDMWGFYKVNGPTAWATTMGSGVTVAVVDTGVDLGHPDLLANLLPGASFVPTFTQPSDDVGHGTHVAGIIAALGNNTLGVAGLAANAQIVPVKIMSSSPGQMSWAENGYVWAMTNGNVDVINNSWGATGVSSALDASIRTANLMGIVTVNAAGNNNTATTGFAPTNVEYGISVAATDASDVRASYSNMGVKLDVAAPGGNGSTSPAASILSTVPSAFSTSYIDAGSRYAVMSGTSMAAPYVSGLAALILAQHPTWTAEQVRQAIRRSATDVDAAGFDANTGFGRINAALALANTATPPSAQIITPRNDASIQDTVALSGFALPSPTLAATFQLTAGAGNAPSSWTNIAAGTANMSDANIANVNTLNLPDGATTLRLRTLNTTGGLVAEDRNLVEVDNVYIQTPFEGQRIAASSINVLGKVMGNLGFANYTLAWAPGHNATTGFTTFATVNTQKPAGSVLGPWTTTPAPEGPVSIKLTAQFSSHVSIDTVNVIIDRKVMTGFPARILDPMGRKTPKIIDLDNDGVRELVIGTSVYLPNGQIKAGWNYNPGMGRTVPAITNIDSSSDKEIIAAVFSSYFYDSSLPNNGATQVVAYKPNKTAVWTFPVLQSVGSWHNGTPSSVSVGDVDGDGKNEVVFTMFFAYNNPNSKTTVFVLDAATGAQEQRFDVAGFSWSAVALANFDGDSALELVFDTFNNATNQGFAYVMNGNGTNVPGWPQTAPAGSYDGFGEIDPVIADVDNNCSREILIGRYLFKANGTPYNANYPATILSRSTGVLANLDSDPQLEMLGGAANMVSAWGLETTPSVNFAMLNSFENTLFMGFNENFRQGNPIVADVNGDGIRDMVRGDELGSGDPTRAMPLYVYSTNNGGALSSTRYVSTSYNGSSLPHFSTATVGDLNSDGKLDIAVVSRSQVWVWNMGVTYNASLAAWPMYQRDYHNTGAVPISGLCPVPVTPELPKEL